MPRLGQLLSALLVALIGVLVMQMFLLAGMQQRMAADQPIPPAAHDTMSLPAPASAPPLAVTPLVANAAQQAPAAQRTLVIIIMANDPPPASAPARMLDLPQESPLQLAPQPAGGRVLIERFIALSGKPLGSSQPGEEGLR